MDMHTLHIFKMNNQQGPTVQHSGTLLNVMAAWMGWELGENGYMYVWLRPSCSPESITTLLTGYTRTPNKKFCQQAVMEKFGYRLNIR